MRTNRRRCKHCQHEGPRSGTGTYACPPCRTARGKAQARPIAKRGFWKKGYVKHPKKKK